MMKNERYEEINAIIKEYRKVHILLPRVLGSLCGGIVDCTDKMYADQFLKETSFTVPELVDWAERDALETYERAARAVNNNEFLPNGYLPN